MNALIHASSMSQEAVRNMWSGLDLSLIHIFVIAGVFCWGKLHAEEQKVAEEVWELPIEIENSEA